jgi:hypothetical protein
MHNFNWSVPVDVRLVFSGKQSAWRKSIIKHVDLQAQKYLGAESLRWPRATIIPEAEKELFKVPTTGFNVVRIIDFLNVSTAIDLFGFDFYDGNPFRLHEAMHLPVAEAHSYANERDWVLSRAVDKTDIKISLR